MSFPIKSDSEHFPLEGKLRVFRSQNRRKRLGAAHSGAAAERLLRQRAAQCDGCRLRWTPAAFTSGPRAGQVYASADSGDTWAPIVRDLPAVLSVEVQTLP